MTSWYGVRAIAGLDYLADFAPKRATFSAEPIVQGADCLKR